MNLIVMNYIWRMIMKNKLQRLIEAGYELSELLMMSPRELQELFDSEVELELQLLPLDEEVEWAA